jgi:hypothetical protein
MKILYFLISVIIVGCATIPPTSNSGTAAEPPTDIKTVNYTPFHSVVGNGDSPSGEGFLSFAIKVSFDPAARGPARLSVEQPPFIERDSVINELAAFRKKAELYVVTTTGPVKAGSVTINGVSTDLKNSEWIVRERAYGLTLLAPYLDGGDTVSISTKEKTLRFSLPKLFSPYLLARYETGAMMPTPMRGDTIVVDLDAETMSVVYRTTVPTTPTLRGGEFRLIVDPVDPYPGSSIAETRARFEAQQEYLRRCTIPQIPIEPCAVPDHLPARAFFE